MRAISEQFMDDLLKPEGLLYPIRLKVKKDQTLMLAIRKGYINIYYRGGNILKILEHTEGVYQTSFDKNYNKTGQMIPDSPATIKSLDDAKIWVASLPLRKNIMDEYFSTYGKAEREFQQLVARENNYSSISNESEYFISDIEVTDPDPGARFDMMAIRWLASKRKSGANCLPAFIEMKYGDGALNGDAGMLKHLRDINEMISNKEGYKKLLRTMESQFNQLDQLGLLNFNKGKSEARVELNDGDKPEVIFILANHNPRSSKLKTILGDPEFDIFEKSSLFDLKFFVASFSGYGLHKKCMLPLAEFRNLLSNSDCS